MPLLVRGRERIGTLTLAYSETESRGGIGDPIAFGPIVAGLVLIGLFVWHSLRVPRPLIELRTLLR